MFDPEALGAVVGLFVLAALTLVGASLLPPPATQCSDGYVYTRTDTYQGCVPYEDIKGKE